ncbi:substrate-binding domain-containing protein [Pseudonocardia sp.]|jgi:ABC-type branched-subunit amino acid transport system substrate-binding protein|uniref:substrate-binding domain-containing protein n=1 Tax=Pseudonocardia sp. TaxID=60912 RepID=UPI0031FD64E0
MPVLESSVDLELLGARDQVNVALVIPRQGPLGIIGPSSELSAELATAEINEAGGVLGRQLRLIPIDGGAAPNAVASEVGALVSLGVVDAVIGTHTSAVRHQLVPRVAHRIPYVYTSIYEGGERNPGVFLTGETPGRQLRPGMRLLADEYRVRRWCVVGNDYVWPRRSAAAARHFARESGGRIAEEMYVPQGTVDFSGVVERVERSDVDAVLVLLVGQDAIQFHRAFAERELHRRCLRLTTLMDENMLLAAGPEATIGLFAAAGYFESLVTPERLEFGDRYARRFGVDAPPVGNLGQSCYEGVRLLHALLEQAQSLDVHAINAVANTVSYVGARGLRHLRDGHAAQRIYLAEAEALEFSVVAELAEPER